MTEDLLISTTFCLVDNDGMKSETLVTGRQWNDTSYRQSRPDLRDLGQYKKVSSGPVKWEEQKVKGDLLLETWMES